MFKRIILLSIFAVQALGLHAGRTKEELIARAQERVPEINVSSTYNDPDGEVGVVDASWADELQLFENAYYDGSFSCWEFSWVKTKAKVQELRREHGYGQKLAAGLVKEAVDVAVKKVMREHKDSSVAKTYFGYGGKTRFRQAVHRFYFARGDCTIFRLQAGCLCAELSLLCLQLAQKNTELDEKEFSAFSEAIATLMEEHDEAVRAADAAKEVSVGSMCKKCYGIGWTEPGKECDCHRGRVAKGNAQPREGGAQRRVVQPMPGVVCVWHETAGGDGDDE